MQIELGPALQSPETPNDFIHPDSLSMSDEVRHHETGMLEAQFAHKEQDSGVELAELQSLLEQHKLRAEITPNGDAGFLIEINPLAADEDLVAHDLDDHLIAYTASKEERLSNFVGHVGTTGLQIDQAACRRLMKITDVFSRWEEHGENMYHIDAHKAALSAAVTLLRGVPAEYVTHRIDAIEAQLQAVKQGHGDPRLLPFHFADGDLAINPAAPLQENLDAVFEPVSDPSIHQDAVDGIVTIGDSGVNQIIFTYGQPKFQLQKVLRLLQRCAAEGKPLPISQIWLTKKPKGRFVEQLASSGSARLVAEVFGRNRRNIILVDDSAKEIDGLLDVGKLVEGKTGATFGGLLTDRDGIKNSRTRWVKNAERYGFYDSHRSTYHYDQYARLNFASRVYNMLARRASERCMQQRYRERNNTPSISSVERGLWQSYDRYVELHNRELPADIPLDCFLSHSSHRK